MNQEVVILFVLFIRLVFGGSWTEINPTGIPIIPHVRAQNALAPSQFGWYIFGGWGGDHILDCFWKYEQDNQTWIRYTPYTFGDGGPSPRFGQRGALVGGILFIFGGQNSTNTFDELWNYNFPSGKWGVLRNSEPSPSPRSFHSLNQVSSNQILVFGGEDQNGELLGDTWIYQTFSSSWTNLSINGPSPRNFHSTAFDEGSGLLYLFGGNTPKGVNNELWTFSILSKKWNLIQVNSPVPSPREGHTSAFGDSLLWIFGGDDQETVFGDLWIFDSTSTQWKLLSESGPENRTQLGYGAYFDGFYVFGGSPTVELSETLMNDLWFYQ